MEEQCAPWRGKLKPDPFATIVPTRTPEVKYHAGLNRAKSAVAYPISHFERETGRWVDKVRGGEVYARTADGWELLYRVEQGTPSDELPWKEPKQ